jgi:serine/threonine protein kinase
MSIGIPRPKSLFSYDVVGTLGEGTSHQMYVVCDPKSGQLYAMKYVARKSEADLKLIDQMNLEFEVTKPLRSSFLRKCVDLKVNKKLIGGVSEAALIMELVDGEAIESLPPIAPVALIDVFMQVARGLTGLHQQLYVHTQIKPHHILVSSDGSAKVIDFGHVCRSGSLGFEAPGMSDFIAPEQVRSKPITALTDVFNLGATMYWALTRHFIPTLLTVRQDQWEALKEQPYPAPAQLNPQVPEPLSKLVMWCCQFSLGSRPADMAMVVGGLEKVKAAVAEKAKAVEKQVAVVAQTVVAPEAEVQPARPRRAGTVSHPLDF